MANPDTRQTVQFLDAFQRAAWIVMTVAQMLLGLSLFITLILKYYMLVIGPEGCLADVNTLGNMICCTGTLDVVAHFIFGVASFRFAAFMFHDRPRVMLGPLMLAVIGVFLLFVSGLTYEVVSWSVAATMVTLVLAVSAIFTSQVFLKLRDSQK